VVKIVYFVTQKAAFHPNYPKYTLDPATAYTCSDDGTRYYPVAIAKPGYSNGGSGSVYAHFVDNEKSQ
jgi:hypothetical protein